MLMFVSVTSPSWLAVDEMTVFWQDGKIWTPNCHDGQSFLLKQINIYKISRTFNWISGLKNIILILFLWSFSVIQVMILPSHVELSSVISCLWSTDFHHTNYNSFKSHPVFFQDKTNIYIVNKETHLWKQRAKFYLMLTNLKPFMTNNSCAAESKRNSGEWELYFFWSLTIT